MRKSKPPPPPPPVSPLIRSNAGWLQQVHKCSRSHRALRAILAEASPAQLLCLVEICFNLLKGRLPADGRRMRALKGRANYLRRLARVRSERSARRLLLPPEQTGAGLPAVAGLLASLLIPIITEKLL
jgi:hypothetical protein